MLAVQTYGRGLGSRSFLHTARDGGCVIHDASYWGCMQLEGSQRDIAQVLRRVRYVRVDAVACTEVCVVQGTAV